MSPAGLDETKLAELRRRRADFVFQAFNLLPALTAEENVEMPLRLDGRKPDPRRTAALLERVGLGNRGAHRPDQLSGGQKQRVAVARALITDPEVVFADEPTGALDIRCAREVLSLLRGLADQGQTIIMVTHDPVAASFSDRVLFLADGLIVDQMARPAAVAVANRMATLVESAERAAAMGVN
ncbi:ectoine/hydroxyectoine ABC transporter, ATP-binding protein [Amycolatopsis methanolica 239]|uniref:Ectoine/hydroxyectoine ABC transporter, ATP-binding protein n=1 Tax=Amycolatopsis methanolica 239 TaxID=1068978 RepID=A0A076N308_AMYME|nr:ectoine/hydroxyectoine ABC transporter, ATP-binding protein [Amycolatopsis methanolica 239]